LQWGMYESSSSSISLPTLGIFNLCNLVRLLFQ
jgi:hypothetical protein